VGLAAPDVAPLADGVGSHDLPTGDSNDEQRVDNCKVADKVTLHVSREKEGKSGLVYARIGRCQGRPAWRGAALRCPAVTCYIS